MDGNNVEHDYEAYKHLLDLWKSENPIKTNKLQVLLAINGLLVTDHPEVGRVHLVASHLLKVQTRWKVLHPPRRLARAPRVLPSSRACPRRSTMGCVRPYADISPEQRLALAVIERAIQDLHPSLTDSSTERGLPESAAEFLNGSDGFYFWTDVLEQDPEWLLHRLHAQLLKESPRVCKRLPRYG